MSTSFLCGIFITINSKFYQIQEAMDSFARPDKINWQNYYFYYYKN